jgi:hypothetical protein
MVGDSHDSAATGFRANQMFVLKRLNETSVGFPFFFGFHRDPSFLSFFSLPLLRGLSWFQCSLPARQDFDGILISDGARSMRAV